MTTSQQIIDKLASLPRGSFSVTRLQEHDQMRTFFLIDNSKKFIRKAPDGQCYKDAEYLIDKVWNFLTIDDFVFYKAKYDRNLNQSFEKLLTQNTNTDFIAI